MYREHTSSTVIHEAGHVIGALAAGVPVRFVEARDDGGQVAFHDRSKLSPWQDLVVSIAGPVTEASEGGGDWRSRWEDAQRNSQGDLHCLIADVTALNGGIEPRDIADNEHFKAAERFVRGAVVRAMETGFWFSLTSALSARKRLTDADLLTLDGLPAAWRAVLRGVTASRQGTGRAAASVPSASPSVPSAGRPPTKHWMTVEDVGIFRALGRLVSGGGRRLSAARVTQWDEYQAAIAREDAIWPSR